MGSCNDASARSLLSRPPSRDGVGSAARRLLTVDVLRLAKKDIHLDTMLADTRCRPQGFSSIEPLRLNPTPMIHGGGYRYETPAPLIGLAAWVLPMGPQGPSDESRNGVAGLHSMYWICVSVSVTMGPRKMHSKFLQQQEARQTNGYRAYQCPRTKLWGENKSLATQQTRRPRSLPERLTRHRKG